LDLELAHWLFYPALTNIHIQFVFEPLGYVFQLRARAEQTDRLAGETRHAMRYYR